MADGAYDLLGTLNAGANGQFHGGAAQGPVAPDATPLPGQQPFVATVPPPGNPPGPPPAAPADAGTPEATSAPSFDLLGTLDAGSKGQFKYSPPPQPKMAPGAAPPQSDLQMNINALANGPFATMAPLADIVNPWVNLGIKGVNKLTGSKIPEFSTDVQAPFPVEPTSEGGRVLVAAEENTTGMLPQLAMLRGLGLLADGSSLTAKVLQQASSVPASAWPSIPAGAAAGQYLADQVPEPYKGAVNVAGNFLGGGAEAIAQHGAAALASGVGGTLSRLGLAPGQNYSAGLPEGSPPIHATPAQASAAVAAVRKAGGSNLQNALDQGLASQENIPGESPTLLQIAPGQEGVSNKLAGVNKTAAANTSEKVNYGQAAFEAQRQRQNAAQIAAIRQLAPQAQPEALANLATNEFNQRLNDLQTAQEQRVAGGQPNAAVFNPPGNTAARGEAVRAGLEAERTAQRAQVSNDFFSSVPDGAKHTALPAKQMANILLGNAKIDLPADAPPEMQALGRKLQQFSIDQNTRTHPAEMEELNRVANQPDTIPYSTTQKLLSNIGIAKNQVSDATGFNSPNMTRLRLLEGSLNDSMSTDLAQRIQQERAAPPSTAGMSLEEALQHFVTRQTAPADQETVTRLYSPPPEINPAAANLQASRQAWRDVATQYDTGPVGQMLAKTDYGRYATPEASTAIEGAIGGGPGMPERTAKVIDAANGNPEILRAVQDHVASKVGQLITNPDGTVNPAKLSALQARNHPAWQTAQLFPSLAQNMKDAAGAQSALDTAATQAAQAYNQFGKSQLGKIIGQIGTPQAVAKGFVPQPENPVSQVPLIVRRAIEARDNGAMLGQLADAAQKNPDAFKALQSEVINQAVNKFAPPTQAGAGAEYPMLDRDGMRSFIADNKPALRKLYGGQGIQHLDRVAASLQQATQATKASVTKGTDPLRLWALFGRIGNMGGEGLGALAGFGGSEALGGEGMTKIAGAVIAGAAIHAVKVLRENGINTKNDLIGAMMLHPQFYQEMTRSYPTTPSAMAVMGKRLMGSLRAINQAQLSGTMPGAPKQ